MRAVDSWLDRFARNHPKFGIPHLINYLLAGSVAVFVLDWFSGGAASKLLGLNIALVLEGEVWRLVTFLFLPEGGRPIWFAVSVFFYYFLGNTMEDEWGTAKFNLFYLSGAALTLLASVVTYFWAGGGVYDLTGLSRVHDTLFLAFATLYPEAQIRLYFVLPLKAKWLAAFYVFLQVWGVVSMGGARLAFDLPFVLPPLLASWANYLIFFWTPVTGVVRRAFGIARHQSSRQTIHFKAAQKKAKETRGYLHKCAVCGLTDADDPNMEFRYCSKCDGYYCYCMDHINNHTHVHQD